jgi:hypothetical protein
MVLGRFQGLDPNDVFVPGRLPLEKTNVYAKRSNPESLLRKHLSRGLVPVVYGEFGVGKTSMVRKHFVDVPNVLYLPTAAKLTLTKVFEVVLESLEYTVTTKRNKGSESGGSGGIDAIVAKASVATKVTVSSESELVVKSPTDFKMLQLLERAKVTIIIDELHRASSKLRGDLSDFIKAVNGLSKAYPRLVLIGTTSDPELLVARDPGIDRIVMEVPIRPLSRPESEFIIRTGFKALGLTYVGETLDRIVRIAAGAPNIVQGICLDLAEAARAGKRSFILPDDLSIAVRNYVSQGHNKRLTERYMHAIETTGPRRYRKQILHAMAGLDKDLVTLDEIRSGVGQRLGVSVPSEALSGPLKELKEDKYGRMLKDVERGSGLRIHNLSRFTDPTMKYFIRFLEEVERQNLWVQVQDSIDG